MKALNTLLKILAALAAVAGAVYVVATYGDKIVAWAKKLWASLPQCPEVTVTAEAPEAEAEEEAAPEEAPVAEEAAPEAEETQEPAPEIGENDPTADDSDFVAE